MRRTMTHDELLEKIKREEDYLKTYAEGYGFVVTDALRAVVELHKPDGFGCAANCIEVDDDGYAWKNTAYPCPTIQAIEKELQCQ
jgi:hypothetical protein